RDEEHPESKAGERLPSPAGPPATATCRAKPEWRPGQVQGMVMRGWTSTPAKERTQPTPKSSRLLHNATKDDNGVGRLTIGELVLLVVSLQLFSESSRIYFLHPFGVRLVVITGMASFFTALSEKLIVTPPVSPADSKAAAIPRRSRRRLQCGGMHFPGTNGARRCGGRRAQVDAQHRPRDWRCGLSTPRARAATPTARSTYASAGSC